ncbi:MAG: hypothetical protein FWC34_04960 [Bacteroidetes bacterium]|nr:hypothetical protein [Bacteroidota bacterium]MCL2303216.1 hypothetical protein [Lentimicrobiaceae bacterium]
MKKNVFIIWFVVLTSSAFGQQFLWSTVKDSTSKYVPLENVTKEVLTFYDHYKFYYDLSGFSKDVFFEFVEEFGMNSGDWKDFKKKVYEIEDLTVFVFRANLGRGSVVTVVSINKEDINMIMFTNAYEADYIMTHRSEREKFAKWFKTLLNYVPGTGNDMDEDMYLDSEPAYRPNMGSGTGSGVGSGSSEGTDSSRGIGYGSGNRGIINIPDVNINESGVIYVEVHVTEQGDVINARILSTPKYPTNITNEKTQQEVLRRALAAKYTTGKEELRILAFK